MPNNDGISISAASDDTVTISGRITDDKGNERVEKFDVISDDYQTVIDMMGHPIFCEVTANIRKKQEYNVLDIMNKKRMMSFQYDNGAIGYRRITHLLLSEKNKRERLMGTVLGIDLTGDIKIGAESEPEYEGQEQDGALRSDFAVVGERVSRHAFELALKQQKGHGKDENPNTIGAEYAIYCSPSGDIELYKVLDDSIVDTDMIGKFHAANRITDPMFAFETEDHVYVVLNIPTKAAIEGSESTRMPSISEDGTVAASGVPTAIRFPKAGGDGFELFPRRAMMTMYACALVPTESGLLPNFLIYNILSANAPVVDDEESAFITLFMNLVKDNDKSLKMKNPEIPVGVSIAEFLEEAEYALVPMNGLGEAGIEKVILGRASGENNEVRFCNVAAEPPKF